jgi:hypothetical protein
MGFWLCADCYARLEARPVKYGMVPVQGQKGEYRERQDVTWAAAIAEFEGVTFGAFIRTVAKRFMQRTRPTMEERDAYDMAISCLKELGDTFGDAAYDWSHAGAREIADDEMSYWDAAEGGNA